MGKALVVDDDEKNRKLIEDLLAIKKIDVISFEKGEEAVENASEELLFCVIDIRLPDIPGFEVARRIKEKYPDLPCIAYTASALEERVKRIKETGVFDEFVLKPIDIKSFFEIVDRYL